MSEIVIVVASVKNRPNAMKNAKIKKCFKIRSTKLVPLKRCIITKMTPIFSNNKNYT